MSTIQAKLNKAQKELETCLNPERIEELEALIEHYKAQLNPSPHGQDADLIRREKDKYVAVPLPPTEG